MEKKMRKTFERQRPAGKRSGFFKRDLERQRPAGKGSGFFPAPLPSARSTTHRVRIVGFAITIVGRPADPAPLRQSPLPLPSARSTSQRVRGVGKTHCHYPPAVDAGCTPPLPLPSARSTSLRVSRATFNGCDV